MILFFQQTLLRITSNTVNDPQRVVRIVEAALEASFQDQVSSKAWILSKSGVPNLGDASP
jgi:hypothetical protein